MNQLLIGKDTKKNLKLTFLLRILEDKRLKDLLSLKITFKIMNIAKNN